MSLALRVAITAPDLSAWRETVAPERLHAVLGRAYANLLQEHFRTRNAQPNAKGFPRTNFWSDVAKRTGFDSADADGATVVIADPRFALRLFGGVVRPRSAKSLALPLVPEAAGRSPREFADLFVLRSRILGRAFLATRESSGALRLLYLLAPSTNHTADPAALPDDARTSAALTATAESFLRRNLS